jgi:1-deoxy-D-xylulose-5-phosphate synthase
MSQKERGLAAATPDAVEAWQDVRRLRILEVGELPTAAERLRQFVLESVTRSGGHLAAGLGVVELTIALHYVFDTPRDALVWDIGHQAYPHKVLTGRGTRLATIRQRHGLSGFLSREESPYDAFGAGHSSTSISAALGMAIAHTQLGLPHHAIAVIGDGALQAGMAYEALNHAGALKANLLVVLNDNDMSISRSVGALVDSLQRVRAQTAHEAPAQTLFEHLGFSYLGAVDGHDLPALVRALSDAKANPGPRLLHVVTRKGHGHAPAEANPIAFHAVAPPKSTSTRGDSVREVSYSQVFGDWLCEEAARNPKLIAITPAMCEGSALVRFAREFPARCFDAGIAEQHSVTLGAGLACRGMRPIVAIYSTFLQRAYDQLIHDVCIQKLPVVFALDRAGVVGPDGATHNGAFDLSFLRCIPGLTVMVPADGAELRDMLHTAVHLSGPVAVRYPRTATQVLSSERPAQMVPIGQAQVCRSGQRAALLCFGPLLPAALQAAETLNATVVNMRFLKPLDVAMVLRMARRHELLVTLEDNTLAGGAGSAVGECLLEHGARTTVLQLGLPDRFLPHGSRDQILCEAGLDADSILNAVRTRLEQLIPVRNSPSHQRASAGVYSAAQMRLGDA